MSTNTMMGVNVTATKDASGDVVGLNAGGVPIPQMSKKLAAAIRPLIVGDQSLRFVLAGDSTGNEDTEWAYLFAQALAAKYPAHTVDYRLFNSATDYYGQNIRLSTGTGGAAHVVTGSAAGSWRYTIADSATLSPVGDIDLRCVIDCNGSLPSADMSFLGKWITTGGQRSVRLVLKTTGVLTLENSIDGINTVTRSSVGSLSGADLTGPIHIRAVLDVDNGASGNTTNFYKSLDGTTWDTLGNAVIVAGVTSLFNSTAAWQFIGFNGLSLATQDHDFSFYGCSVYAALGNASRIIDIDVADGLNTTTVASSTFVDRCGNTVSVAQSPANGSMIGAPVLLFSNANVGGAAMTYHSDAGRYPKWVHGAPDVAMINHGHNDLTDINYRVAAKALTDLLLTSNPDIAICFTTQNQRAAPATYPLEHRIRMRQIASFAGGQGFDLIDTWRYVTAEMTDDGIHPNAVGKPIMAGVVKAYFGIA